MVATRASVEKRGQKAGGGPRGAWKEPALYGLDLALRLFWFLVSVLGLAPCVGWLTVESEVGRYLETAAGDQLKLGEYHRMSEQDPLRLLDGLHPTIREALFQVPRVAAPTMLLWAAAASLIALAVTLHVHLWIGGTVTVALITVAMLAMFTVAHEAAHGSISSVPFVNGVFGRLSFPCLGPLAVFGPWRVRSPLPPSPHTLRSADDSVADDSSLAPQAHERPRPRSGSLLLRGISGVGGPLTRACAAADADLSGRCRCGGRC